MSPSDLSLLTIYLLHFYVFSWSSTAYCSSLCCHYGFDGYEQSVSFFIFYRLYLISSSSSSNRRIRFLLFKIYEVLSEDDTNASSSEISCFISSYFLMYLVFEIFYDREEYLLFVLFPRSSSSVKS